MIKVKNCLDCPAHVVEEDGNFMDYSIKDSLRVRCTFINKEPYILPSGAILETKPYVAVSCLPQNLRKECECPSWCPLDEYNIVMQEERQERAEKKRLKKESGKK